MLSILSFIGVFMILTGLLSLLGFKIIFDYLHIQPTIIKEVIVVLSSIVLVIIALSTGNLTIYVPI